MSHDAESDSAGDRGHDVEAHAETDQLTRPPSRGVCDLRRAAPA
jgi:hypothetical protein